MGKNKYYYSHDIATIQNAATTMLANIRFASMDSPVKSIVVTSAGPNEGKSTIAKALAEAIAAGGKSVLVIDCDTRNRSQAMIFGIRPKAGLCAVLSGQVSVADAVASTATQGVSLLDIEPNIPNPANIFGSRRFTSFIRLMSEQYDHVIIDTPPVGAFVDAAVISSHVDGCVLVIGEGVADRKDAADAAEQLRKAGANVLGVAMNYCKNASGSHYGGGYYGKDRYGGTSQAAADSLDSARPSATAGGTRFKR